MPKFKEVSLSVGRTVNMGNYESLRIELGASATIEAGVDDPEIIVEEMSDWLRRRVRKLVATHSRDAKD